MSSFNEHRAPQLRCLRLLHSSATAGMRLRDAPHLVLARECVRSPPVAPCRIQPPPSLIEAPGPAACKVASSLPASNVPVRARDWNSVLACSTISPGRLLKSASGRHRVTALAFLSTLSSLRSLRTVDCFFAGLTLFSQAVYFSSISSHSFTALSSPYPLLASHSTIRTGLLTQHSAQKSASRICWYHWAFTSAEISLTHAV
jgi:hypothetical protein